MSDSSTSLKILITQRDLKALGGSEIFTIEMSQAMRSRGHEVRVYAPGGGDGVLRLQSNGIHVIAKLEELPWVPDIIHGQHHLQTMTALTRFPEVPAVYHMHGGIPWVEQPPVHGNIMRYIVICEAMAQGMETFYNIPIEKVVTIRNYVDLQRFSRVREANAQPKRALVFGNHRYPEAQLKIIEDTCAERGIEVEHVGAHLGNASLSPESILAEYDIVFAIGRCAIEALASGCAVIPVTPDLAGSLISLKNLARMADSNFSPRYYSPEARLSKEWLTSQILEYRAEEVRAVTAAIRKDHGMKQAIDMLEALHSSVVDEFSKIPSRPLLDVLADVHAYLAWIGPETDKLWADAWEVRKAQMALEEVASLRVQHGEQITAIHSLTAKLEKLTLQREKISQKYAALERTWQVAEQYFSRGIVRRYFWKRFLRKRKSSSG